MSRQIVPCGICKGTGKSHHIMPKRIDFSNALAYGGITPLPLVVRCTACRGTGKTIVFNVRR